AASDRAPHAWAFAHPPDGGQSAPPKPSRRCPQKKGGLVPPPLAPPGRVGERLTATLVCEPPQVGFDGGIAGIDLPMIKLVQCHRLPQGEQVLLSPVALQRTSDRRLTLLTTRIAQPRQLLWHKLATLNRLDHAHASHPPH